MTKEQMREFITANVQKQGNEGAINIAPLLFSMVDKLFADPITGVVPVVVEIAEQGEKDGTKTRYDIATEQQSINTYIDDINEEKAKARIFVQDGSAIIGFSYLEIDTDTITGVSVAPDGIYKIYLSKVAGTSYFEHDDETKSIASVTEAEISGYNAMFGATYNPVNNRFDVQIGTVHTQLTPGQMMLTTEEYNKVSNDADYTAMWRMRLRNTFVARRGLSGSPGLNCIAHFIGLKRQSLLTLMRLNYPLQI